METILRDVRYGLRQLRRSPAFTVVAVMTLALGIAASTTIFTIVNAVLLRPLPYPDPDELVKISFDAPGVGLRDIGYSAPELDDLRAMNGVFEQVSATFPASVNLTGARHPERLELLGVSPEYFALLRAQPQMGRLFDAQDVAFGFAPVAVISDALWKRSYGGESSVLNRVLRLDNDPYTIVGVLPPGFRHPGKTVSGDVDVWVTAGFRADPFPAQARNVRFIPGAIGRLRAGVSLGQAQAQLSARAAQLRQDFPIDYPPRNRWTIDIEPLQGALVGNVRPMLLVLMSAVAVIVLIVTVNIANLLLARASVRQQEMAIRWALGATGGRLIRQLLTEALLLASIAAILGTLLSVFSLGAIVRALPGAIPRLQEVAIDGHVLLFALLTAVFTGIVFGLAPALQLSRSGAFLAIREGSRGAGLGTRSGRVRDGLVIAELALAAVLMVGAGLLLRTFENMSHENPGFDASDVVTASVWLPVPNDPRSDPYNTIAQQARFVTELLAHLASIPGVERSTLTSALPASGQANNALLIIEDRPQDASQDLRAEAVRITPDYFRALRTPFIRGRDFARSDDADHEPVAIIDASTARRYWPGADPIGRRIRLGTAANSPWLRIIGIVDDVRYDTLDIDGVPHVYVSMYQRVGRVVNLILRTPLPSGSLEGQIRTSVQSVDPALPVYQVASMNALLDASLAPRRLSATLVGCFAVAALVLASLGIYGTLAYMIGQRSRELGIRIAVGARRADVVALVVRKGLLLAGVGVSVGAFVALIAGPLLAASLYGVRPGDPAVLGGVVGLLFLIGLIASYVPARRAAGVDPAIVLREA